MKPLKKLFSLLGSTFKRYFLFGLFALIPIYVTIGLLVFFVTYLDRVLAIKNGYFLYFIPMKFHPDFLLGIHIPGLGLIFTVIIVLLTGVFSRGFLGRTVLGLSDRLLARIPMARIVYNVAKQVVETFAHRDKNQFSRVIMIEYPRKGIYTLAFVVGENEGEIQEKTPSTVLNVFVPTTPNPTSGFYLLVPKEETVPLSMTIEEAFKLVMSGGLVASKKGTTAA